MSIYRHILETEKEFNLDELMHFLPSGGEGQERAYLENRNRNKADVYISNYGWLHYGETLACERQVEGTWETHLAHRK